MTVVTGVWGGMSLSRLRDVVTNGSCQRDQSSMDNVRVELHLSKTPTLNHLFGSNFITKNQWLKKTTRIDNSFSLCCCPHCAGMLVGTGTAIFPFPPPKLGLSFIQSTLLFVNSAANLQEAPRFFLSFFLAIFTLPFQSVFHLFCHFFQNHLNNVSTSEIHFASWLSPKYWAL